MTEDLKAKIHAAMQAAGGSQAKAAEILGIPREQLKGMIYSIKELSERWRRKRGQDPVPPSEAVTLHRPAVPLSSQLAEAIEREDQAVRKGIQSLGYSGVTLEMAVALQKFQKKHFASALEMLGGGITKQFLDVMAEVEKINRELDRLDCDTGSPEAAAASMAREMMLREDRARLLEIMQKFYDRANQAGLTQAKVRALQNEGAGKAKVGKPGFTPLVAVQASGNVTIQEK